MQEFRCVRCNRLLCKVSYPAQIEIKCTRCKFLNQSTMSVKSGTSNAKPT
ncbi:Com family DNA-binding transcriptional regulator [Shewanella halifaxensis]